eukprot:scaffold3667_cov110-Isochrysis_galbana.AAC.13
MSGPRHRLNTTLSISRLMASRRPFRAGHNQGPQTAWSIVGREGLTAHRDPFRFRFRVCAIQLR